MGTWVIQIRGHGSHHNSRQDDANIMAATFVGELLERGHSVSEASFTLTGGTEDLKMVAPQVTSRNYNVVAETEHGQKILTEDRDG